MAHLQGIRDGVLALAQARQVMVVLADEVGQSLLLQKLADGIKVAVHFSQWVGGTRGPHHALLGDKKPV